MKNAKELAKQIVLDIGNSEHGLIGFDDMYPKEMDAMIDDLAKPIEALLLQFSKEESERAVAELKELKAENERLKNLTHFGKSQVPELEEKVKKLESEAAKLVKLETQHKHDNDLLRFSLQKQEQEHQEDKDNLAKLESENVELKRRLKDE